MTAGICVSVGEITQKVMKIWILIKVSGNVNNETRLFYILLMF